MKLQNRVVWLHKSTNNVNTCRFSHILVYSTWMLISIVIIIIIIIFYTKFLFICPVHWYLITIYLHDSRNLWWISVPNSWFYVATFDKHRFLLCLLSFFFSSQKRCWPRIFEFCHQQWVIQENSMNFTMFAARGTRSMFVNCTHTHKKINENSSK